LIGNVGWRRAYIIIGFYGVICGLLVMILMAEPVRGIYELCHGNESNIKPVSEQETEIGTEETETEES